MIHLSDYPFHSKSRLFQRFYMKLLHAYLVILFLSCATNAFSKEMVIMTSTDGYLRAIRTTMGGEKWRSYVGTNYLYQPSTTDDLVFIGSDDKCLYALKKSTGRVEWQFEIDGHVISCPMVASDRGLVFFSSDNGYFYAVSIRTGREKWSLFIGNDITASPERATTKLICIGGESGTIYGLDIDNGHIRWTY